MAAKVPQAMKAMPALLEWNSSYLDSITASERLPVNSCNPCARNVAGRDTLRNLQSTFPHSPGLTFSYDDSAYFLACSRTFLQMKEQRSSSHWPHKSFPCNTAVDLVHSMVSKATGGVCMHTEMLQRESVHSTDAHLSYFVLSLRLNI